MSELTRRNPNKPLSPSRNTANVGETPVLLPVSASKPSDNDSFTVQPSASTSMDVDTTPISTPSKPSVSSSKLLALEKARARKSELMKERKEQESNIMQEIRELKEYVKSLPSKVNEMLFPENTSEENEVDNNSRTEVPTSPESQQKSTKSTNPQQNRQSQVLQNQNSPKSQEISDSQSKKEESPFGSSLGTAIPIFLIGISFKLGIDYLYGRRTSTQQTNRPFDNL
jgi:hypothetical protein